MIDILADKVLEKKILTNGMCRLVDVMPRLVTHVGETCDHAITQMARVSYGGGTKTVSEDKALIRYLMRNLHSSPFEAVEFKFHMKLPLFCAAQIIRHRTASVNQESARYSVLKDEFYIPENIRKQSKENKQGSEEIISAEESTTYINDIKNHCKESYDLYEIMIDEDVTREQARMILPQNIMTQWYWKIDLNNLLKFLALRCDAHAQWETRQYADAILELITPLVPWTIEAWNEYSPLRNAINFTEKELKKLAQMMIDAEVTEATTFDISLNSGNQREDKEWVTKLRKIASLSL